MTIFHSYDGLDPEEFESHQARVGIMVTARPLAGRRRISSRGFVFGDAGTKVWSGEQRQGLVLTSDARADAVVVYAPTSGSIRIRAKETESEASAGALLVGAGSEISAVELAEGSGGLGFSIDRTLLESRLTQLLDGRSARGLRFDAVTSGEAQGAQALLQIVAAMIAVAGLEDVRRGSAALAGLMRALPDMLLECLPHTHTDKLMRPPPAIAPRHVRRAMAYIEDQPMPVLTVDELAAVCGVGVRSLQYSFRNFVGLTPAEYWRKIRLECALDQLRRSPSESVSRVAAEWGFTNVTRFRALAGLRTG